MEFNLQPIDYVLPFLVTVFIILLYHFFTSTFSFWKDRGIPYVDATPLFGNITDHVLGKKSLIMVYQDIYDKLQTHKCGGFFRMKIPTLMIKDPELVDKMLVKDFFHFYDRGIPSDIKNDPMSSNLFMLGGQQWRNLRYKLTPTFTTGKLKGMFDQIKACTDNLVSFLDKESKLNSAINTTNVVNGFTLDVVASCAFGIQLDKDDNMSKEFRKNFSSILQPPKLNLIRAFIFTCLPRLRKLLQIKTLPKNLEDLVMSVVTNSKQYREANNIVRNDFLQLMMNLQKQEQSGQINIDEDFQAEDEIINQLKHATSKGKKDPGDSEVMLTDSIIAAQAFVFLIAGSESVSSTINFALLCLTQYPEILAKLQNEINTVVERNNGKWSYQTLKEMEYLDLVIQETLRMYPIAPQLIRECTEPYKIPGTDYIIDKGVHIVIPVYSIHNDSKNYASPNVFNPERFEGNSYKPNGAYIPFGNGPRICIGMRFALIEVKLVLAKILLNFTVKLNKKTQLPIKIHKSSAVTLQVDGGLWFEFEKKNSVKCY